MVSKRVLIGVCLVLSTILLSCNGNRNQPTEVNYRVGSEGLYLSFLSGTPSQIYENDADVRVPIEIQNRGAFPQYDELSEFEGYVWIGGYDPNIIQASFEEGDIRKQLDPEELEGKSPFNLEGGKTIESLLLSVSELPQGTAAYEPTLSYYLTYLYKTIASEVVCIDPDPRSVNVRNKVCSLSDFSTTYSTSSQGAPVAVTKIEEVITSSQVVFKFDVQNVGSGYVIERDLVPQNPNEYYDWRELNRVYIDDVRLGDITVDRCKPDMGESVELHNNIGHFQCTISTSSISTNQAYKTPLTVTLSYGYADSQFRNIKIVEAIEI